MKKVLCIILAMVCCMLFTCCDTVKYGTATDMYPTFKDDFLCGFLCEFQDSQGNPINDIAGSLDNDNSVMTYITKTKDNVISTVYGGDSLETFISAQDVFVDGGIIEITARLHYTYKLLDIVVVVNDVLYSSQDNTVELGQSRGLKIGIINSGVRIAQNLEESGKDSQGNDVTITHNVNIKFELIYCDYLNEVKVLEFDSDNNLIKESIFSQYDQPYQPSANCEYVVVEKSYDIKNAEGVTTDTYLTRDLVNKPYEQDSQINEDGQTVTLELPQENGLVKLVRMAFEWEI